MESTEALPPQQLKGEIPLTRLSWWRRPGVRFRYALIVAVVGLVTTLAAAVLNFFFPPVLATAPVTMDSLRVAAGILSNIRWTLILIFSFVAGGLGLYLAFRTSRHPLVALLSVACASVSASFGFVVLMFAMVNADYYLGQFLITALSAQMDGQISTAGLVVIAVIMTVAAIGLALFVLSCISFTMFYLQYPGKVIISGSGGESTQSGNVKLISRASLRNFSLPAILMLLYAFTLLLPGLLSRGSMSMAGMTGALLASSPCFIPFLLVYAKRPHLSPKEQSSFNWLLLGQTLTVFLFIAIAITLLVWGSDSGYLDNSFTRFMGFYGQTMTIPFMLVFHTVSLIALAAALLSKDTLDPGLMVRRTWVIGVTAMLSSMLFLLLERLAAGWLINSLGLGSDTALTVIAALVAATFFPLRHWSELRMKALFDRYLSPEHFAGGERMHVTVVFSDLSGYSALSAHNESEALLTAALFHRAARLHAPAFGGKVIKTIGDAVMMVFPDAIQAINATRKIHADYATKAEGAGTTLLEPHTGIHTGDVIMAGDGDVYGSTVNIAARLQSFAQARQIVLSYSAQKELDDGSASPLGQLVLKNIPQPVDAYLIVA